MDAESNVRDSASTISYDDPDAPWNREYSPEEMVGWNDGVVTEFRENGGKVAGDYAGATLLLLTTTGAKSGRSHLVPLGALYRDDTLYVSSFVEGKYPAWFHNAKANPQVTVELGGETFAATAEVLEGARYDEFAAWALANNSLLAEYQATVDKPLPLVVLRRDA